MLVVSTFLLRQTHSHNGKYWTHPTPADSKLPSRPGDSKSVTFSRGNNVEYLAGKRMLVRWMSAGVKMYGGEYLTLNKCTLRH